MKTKTHFLKIGSTFVECLFIIISSFATLIFTVGFFSLKPNFKEDKIPFEIMEAIESLENKDDWIHMQRKHIEMVSKALTDGIITSKDLKQDGDAWVREQNLRVNIREAKIYWSQLQDLGENARYGLSKWQISEAERLAKLIEEQFDMPYANEEGLTVSKTDLEFSLYRVHHHGSKPCKPLSPALLGSSDSP